MFLTAVKRPSCVGRVPLTMFSDAYLNVNVMIRMNHYDFALAHSSQVDQVRKSTDLRRQRALNLIGVHHTNSINDEIRSEKTKRTTERKRKEKKRKKNDSQRSECGENANISRQKSMKRQTRQLPNTTPNMNNLQKGKTCSNTQMRDVAILANQRSSTRRLRIKPWTNCAVTACDQWNKLSTQNRGFDEGERTYCIVHLHKCCVLVWFERLCACEEMLQRRDKQPEGDHHR